MDNYDVGKVEERWGDYVDMRNSYAFCDEDIDLEDFKELVKETYDIIKAAKVKYIYSNKMPEDVRLIFDFLRMLSTLSQYTVYDDSEDESTDKIFTATTLVAQGLVSLSIWCDDIRLKDGKRVYFLDEEKAKGELLWNRLDFPYTKKQLEEGNLDKNYTYNVYEGDLTQFIELANRLI